MSYRLHAELAEKHGGAKRWGYRTVYCGSLAADGRERALKNGENVSKEGEWEKLPKMKKDDRRRGKGVKIPKDLDWFAKEQVTAYSPMGDPSNTAQVHPYQFTTSMAELAKEEGVNIIMGSVTAVGQNGGKVESVSYVDKETMEEKIIPDVTDVIISAGPWTPTILPSAPISAMRAHSVTIKADVTNWAVFSEIDLPAGFDGRVKSRPKTVSPEMYARPNGEVYACGEGDHVVPLPKSADLVQVDDARCQEIIDYCGSISDEMRNGDVLVRQACYLPSVTDGGGPLIGKTDTKGLFLATGHTCWGIQNSCATGKLMSEFVFDGEAKSADVRALDPRRYL